MGKYEAKVAWSRGDQPFLDKRYSRAHSWTFDGGAVVPGSSAPASVPLPMSDPSAVDPEEAMIASLSSCHMLWFLAFAATPAWWSTPMSTRLSARWARTTKGAAISPK